MYRFKVSYFPDPYAIPNQDRIAFTIKEYNIHVLNLSVAN